MLLCRPRRAKLKLSLFLIAFLLPVALLAGCGYNSDPPRNGLRAQVEYTATPSPEPTITAIPTTFAPPLSADCGWFADVQAFVDKNRNKRWDKGEPPLAGVKFHVDDILNHFTDVAGEASSDAQGSATLEVGLPGCPDVDFEVYADSPAGYTLTTKERVNPRDIVEDVPVLFGFVPIRNPPPTYSGTPLPGMPGTGHP